MFEIERLTSTSSKVESFFESQHGRSLFVGGIDRAGTTKVGEIFHQKLGLFIPEIFLAVEIAFACWPNLNSSKLRNFFDSYQGKYFDCKNFEDVKSIEEFFKIIIGSVHNVADAPLIETSPRNLENYQFLSDNVNAGFIYMVRDLDQVWASYRKNGWAPKNKNKFINHYFKKLQLLNLVKDRDNVIICDYSDISRFEQRSLTMPNIFEGLKMDSILSNFQNYTIEQHKLVGSSFSVVNNRVDRLSSAASLNSFVYSSYLGKLRNNLWTRLIIELLEKVR